MDIKTAIEILGDKFEFSAIDTNAVIQDLDIPKNGKVLDIGTGFGSLAIVLAINGYQVVTGEPQHDETVYAKQDWLGNAKRVNVDHLIEFKPIDAERLPFPDGFFDGVFCLGSLHHIDENNRELVLREFFRTVKSNSIVCIFEPNEKAINMLREKDPTHPDAADPDQYVNSVNTVSRKIEGIHFNAFIFKSPPLPDSANSAVFRK